MEQTIPLSDGVLREGCAVKYAWIDAHCRMYPLPEVYEVLGVSASGYRAWKAGSTCTTRLSDAQALVLIRTIHTEVRGAYGSRRVHQELRARGQRIGLSRVERLMSEHGIRARVFAGGAGQSLDERHQLHLD